MKPDIPVTRKVLARDLSPEERRVVEKLLGKGLGEESRVEIRDLSPSASAFDDAEQAERLARLHEARMAITAAASPVADEELDEILGDRPVTAAAGADRR